MKSGILKRFLYGLLIIMILFMLWVAFPRIWSALNPDNPPVGYYFTAPAYIAIITGLEKLADLNPEIPQDIEEIKNIEYKNIDGKSLKFDIYRLKNLTDTVPLLVFIHGGSWKGGQDPIIWYTWSILQKEDMSLHPSLTGFWPMVSILHVRKISGMH